MFDLPPITQRIDKARRDLGFEPRPFAAGLAEAFAWYLRQPPNPRQFEALDVERLAR